MRLDVPITHSVNESDYRSCTFEVSKLSKLKGEVKIPMAIVAKLPLRKPHGFHKNTVDSRRRDNGRKFLQVVIFRRSSRQEGIGPENKKHHAIQHVL